jgi:hypothetical protein
VIPAHGAQEVLMHAIEKYGETWGGPEGGSLQALRGWDFGVWTAAFNQGLQMTSTAESPFDRIHPLADAHMQLNDWR